MQKLNSELLKKQSKRKTSIKDSILFTILSLCTIITLIELINL